MKFLVIILLLCSISSWAQYNQGTLFTDFDLASKKLAKPSTGFSAVGFRNYLRYPQEKSTMKHRIEFIKYFKDTLWDKRKASICEVNRRVMIAFDRMKTAGYEKVLFFGDKDYYYDTLLFLKDSFVFKEMMDNSVELSMVYQGNDDTLMVKYGYRNVRYDFLDKFSFQPAMKDYVKWFDNPYLDYVETYSLVRRVGVYELIKIETTQKNISEYDYKRLREKFASCQSAFWVALFPLTF